MTTPGYEGWAIVELMGHVRIAGYVREVTQYGAAMGRIDIPGEGDKPIATQFFGGASVYRITPVSEEAARAVAARSWPEPVYHWELPAPKPAVGQVAEYDPYDPEPIEDRADPPACRVCGCTQANACVIEGAACYWAEPDLCSVCRSNEEQT